MTLIPRRKLYQEVLDRLVTAITTAEFPPGSQLPSERELMLRFGVGRPAIREAMLTLQQWGVIRITHGERARVVNPTPETIIDQFSGAMVMMLAIDPRGLDHLKEARLLLETGLVRIAARRATPADLAALDEAQCTLEAASGDPTRFVAADMAFHALIAEISGNSIIAATTRGMLDWLSRFKRDLVSVPGADRLTIAEHDRIRRAIAAGDADEAVAAMTAHLTRANALYAQLARELPTGS
jgi:DNA-binding FadR family transcriptional regulator